MKPSLIIYTGQERMYAVYSRLNNQIISIHPVLDVANKIKLILSSKLTPAVCMLNCAATITTEDCSSFKITNFNPIDPRGDTSFAAIKSRGEFQDLLTPDCLPIGSLAYSYPVATTIEPNDSVYNDDLLQYIIYVLEKNWWSSQGYLLYDYALVIESYMQCKDLFRNKPDVMEFLEYDVRTTEKEIMLNNFGAEVYQACLEATTVNGLKETLLEIAERTGSISWEI